MNRILSKLTKFSRSKLETMSFRNRFRLRQTHSRYFCLGKSSQTNCENQNLTAKSENNTIQEIDTDQKISISTEEKKSDLENEPYDRLKAEILLSREFVNRGFSERLVGYWLLASAAGVLAMIVIGGYTRLSKSGLSMVRWKPIDAHLPR